MLSPRPRLNPKQRLNPRLRLRLRLTHCTSTATLLSGQEEEVAAAAAAEDMVNPMEAMVVDLTEEDSVAAPATEVTEADPVTVDQTMVDPALADLIIMEAMVDHPTMEVMVDHPTMVVIVGPGMEATVATATDPTEAPSTMERSSEVKRVNAIKILVTDLLEEKKSRKIGINVCENKRKVI